MEKIALITGATSGFGEATARLLAEEGYRLIITGRRVERLRELKKELKAEFGTQVLPLNFDIRDRARTEAALDSMPEEYRAIDILVNNAGLAAGLEHIDQGDPNDWDAMIDTNIKGLLYITRKVARGMIARGGGHIVNVGSIAGTQPYESGAVYAATKHAVHALSQGMRMDFLAAGLKVTEIRPGMAETEFSTVRFHGEQARADAVYDGVKPLSGDDVAEAVLWAITQPAHVNIDEIVLTCVQQANVYYTHRNNVNKE
jgi:NADP-dependent 3-hydroxy acid dehydrogenase YdfG